MFIAIIGSRAAGKTSVRKYLEAKGFCHVRVSIPEETTPISESYDHPPSLEEQMFPTADALLEFATHRWREHFVTEDLVTQEVINIFSKRPFFLLINVEAPISARFLRRKAVQPELDLESFIEEHDFLTWTAGPSTSQPNNPITSLHALRSFVDVTIVNDFTSIEHLRQHLSELDLLNRERLRPSWDSYFMSLASLAAMRSNCMKRRVGAILVKNNRVMSTGYNGTPRGLTNCNEGGCARCNGCAKSGQALDECLCLHAEENALLEACKGRSGDDGAVIYCNTFMWVWRCASRGNERRREAHHSEIARP